MTAEIASNINTIMKILGSTQPSFWPGFPATGVLVSGLSVGDFIPSESSGSAEALEDDFDPQWHPGGIHSYHFNPTGDHHFAGIDHANYSFADGSSDEPFSVGAWVLPAATATNVIMGKYDSAGNAEEWRFFIDSNSFLSLELHDASASATEIGITASTITIGQWAFVVATYDCGNTDPVVRLYIDSVEDGLTTTTETGSYVAMESGAAPLTLGCSGVTATPVAEFHGRIALPFLTGRLLSAADVHALYGVGKVMLGI